MSRIRSWCARALVALTLLLAGFSSAFASGIVIMRGGGTPTVWFYEIGLRRWSQLPDLPVPIDSGGALMVSPFANDIYVLRGGGTSEFYRMSLSTPTPAWVRIADIPAPVSAGSALGVNLWGPQYIWALAGGGSPTLWRFESATGTWSNAGALPASAGAGSSLSYSFSGGVEAMFGGSTQAYTSEWTPVWSPTSSFPSPVGMGGSIATLYNGCTFALPGGANGAALYSLQSGYCSFQAHAPFPVTPAEDTTLVSSVDTDALMYALAGSGSSAVYRFDVAANTWTHEFDTPAPLGPGADAQMFRGGTLGVPFTYPQAPPRFSGEASIRIDQPIPFSDEVIQGSGLPASANFCIVIGGVNVGCGSTNGAGGFAFNFGTTDVVESYPRTVTADFYDLGTSFSGAQSSGTYPYTLALSPNGTLVMSAPVYGAAAVIWGDGFPKGCESTALYAVGSTTIGLGAFGSGQGSWGYNFNFPPAASTADKYRWAVNFGSCNGYLIEGMNPGGAFPRTVTMHDASTAGRYAVSPASLTFPPSAVGVLSAPQPLTITNTGTGPLLIRDLTLYGGNTRDFLPGGCINRILEPNGTCVLQVRFRPTALGPRTTSLGIAHTDGDGFNLVTLRGGELPDTTPPTITCSATPDVVWPPNGKMVPAAITVNASDADSGLDGYALIAATTSEGDAATEIAGFTVGAASTTGSVRAARAGSGNGRIYSFTYRAMDKAGNSATCTTTISVPHDQRK